MSSSSSDRCRQKKRRRPLSSSSSSSSSSGGGEGRDNAEAARRYGGAGGGTDSNSDAEEEDLVPEAAKSEEARQDVSLMVSGCSNLTISEIIKGTYHPHGTNHGKVIYKKEEDDDDDSSDLDVLIYYWDDKDNPELCGWWFGPSTGGEMVWAYHPSRKATTPPAGEWNVPHDGPIDSSFTVTAAGPGEGKESKQARHDRSSHESEPPRKLHRAEHKKGKDVKKKTKDKSSKGNAEDNRGPTLPHAEGLALGTQEAFINAYKKRKEVSKHKEGQDDGETEEKKREERRQQREEQQRRYDEEQRRKEARQCEAGQKQKGERISAEDTVLKEFAQQEAEDNRLLEEIKKRSDLRKKKQEEHEQKVRAEQSNKEAEQKQGDRERDKGKSNEKEKDTEKEQDGRRRMKASEKARKREDGKSKERENDRRRKDKEDRKKHDKEKGRVHSEDERRDKKERRRHNRQKYRAGSDDKKDKERKRHDRKGDRSSDEKKESSRRHKDKQKRRKDKKEETRNDASPKRSKETAKEEKRSKVRDVKEPKERKEAKERKEPKEEREHNESKAAKEAKEGKYHRQPKETKDAKEVKDTREVKNAKKMNEILDAKEPKTLTQGGDGQSASQQQAIMQVLGVFKKLSEVKVENFAEVKDEFEHVMKTALPETGPQQEILRVEATRVFGYARQYIDTVTDQHQNLDELKKQREREEDVNRTCVQEQAQARANDDKKKIQDGPVGQQSKEELRKKKEDERRRHEEELQRKREERRKRELSELEKEEERRRVEREAKRREEEAKKTERREREAEQERRRAEEEAVKREEEMKTRREQQATLAVLRGLQKLSDASPDNFKQLRTEFEQVMKTELPETGAQRDMLKAEAERVFGYAQQYVEQVKAQQKQANEFEAQRKVRLQHQERTAMDLLERLQQLLKQAEMQADKAQATAAPLCSDQALDDKEALRLARLVEGSSKAGMATCSACSDFIDKNRATIFEAELIRDEAMKLLQTAQPRITAALRIASNAARQAKLHKDKMAKSLAPTLLSKITTDLFNNFDEDGDGFLNRAEVLEYSQQEFNFRLPEENLNRIFHQLVVAGAPGIAPSQLQRLKTAVGIARHEYRGHLKAMSLEERQHRQEQDHDACKARATQRRKVLTALSKNILGILGDLEGKVNAVEQSAEELNTYSESSGEKDVGDHALAAANAHAALTSTRQELAAAGQQARGLKRNLAGMQQLLEDITPDLKAISDSLGAYSTRLRKVATIVKNAQHTSIGRAAEQYEQLRLEVTGKLRACIEALGGKAMDLFQVITKGSGDRVSMNEVMTFLRENQCELDPEKLRKVFAACSTGYLVNEEAGVGVSADTRPSSVPLRVSVLADRHSSSKEPGDAAASHEETILGNRNVESQTEKERLAVSIGRDDFLRIVRVYSKVVKAIDMSDNLSMEVQGELTRSLNVGEVVEVFQGPVMEPSAKVLRVHCRSLTDGIVGWVTISDLQGTTYLVPGGHVMRVLKPCMLMDEPTSIASTTDSLASSVARTLSEGDVIEVLDWQRPTTALGVGSATRILARLRSNTTAVGWVTAVDSSAIRYVEAL